MNSMNPKNFFSIMRELVLPKVLIFTMLFWSIVASLPVSKDPTTVILPAGTTNHGDPTLLCIEATWKQIGVFFAINYLAHAATVKTIPGERLLSSLGMALLALLYPFAGLERGLEAICRRAVFSRSQYHMAAKAGALCVVVRSKDWKPLGGEIIKGAKLANPKGERPSKAQMVVELPFEDEGIGGYDPYPVNKYRRIHGAYHLPKGYIFVILPSTTKVEPLSDLTDLPEGQKMKGQKLEIELSSSHNVIQILVGVFQSVSASITIYRTRGDQISRYGYASFGLTVIPYAIMSIINLFGALLTPDYPLLYMVRSPQMDEAEVRGGRFDGVVGRAVNVHEDDIKFEAGQEPGLVERHSMKIIKLTSRTPWSRLMQETAEAINEAVFENKTLEVHNVDGKFERTIDTGLSSIDKETGVEIQCKEISDTSSETSTQSSPSIFNDQDELSFSMDRGLHETAEIVIPDDSSLQDKSKTTLIIPACCRFKIRGGPKRWATHWGPIITWLFFACIPFVVIKLLSDFAPAQSTLSQRVWTMAWLVLGLASSGAGSRLQRSYDSHIKLISEWLYIPSKWLEGSNEVDLQILLAIVPACIWGVGAIGGFKTVANMLKEYGACEVL